MGSNCGSNMASGTSECVESDDAILQETFTGFRSNKKINCVLTKTGIIAQMKTNKHAKKWDIKFSGVIGCHVKQVPVSEKDVVMLFIYYYPLCQSKKCCTRKQLCHKIIIDSNPSIGENLKTAESWKKKILFYSKNIDPDVEFVKPKYLVFLNPYSGPGNAKKIYKNLVCPMFDEADITHDLIVTEYAGHARKFCKNEELSKWDAIVVVGGDGVLYEVINGLMKRSNWNEAIKIPLGIIAAGSGNGLATSIVFESTGFHFIDNIELLSVFEICKGFVTNMDISSVETLPRETEEELDNQNNTSTRRNVTFCLLSFITGFVADVDIEGEKLRFLGGETRNFIYAILRLITMRKYPLEISYLPTKHNSTQNNGNCNANKGLESGDFNAVGELKKDDPLQIKDSTSLLSCPSLTEQVPEHWKTENAEYLQVLAVMRSHLALKKMVNSEAKLEQGTMYLQLTKATVTRKHVLGIWDNIDNGIGPLNPEEEEKAFDGNVKGFNCKAFRIHPTPRHSKILTIDGERIDFGPLQCEVHKGLARIFCSKVV